MFSHKWLVLWSLWAARLVPHWTPPVRVAGGWLVGELAADMSHVRYMAIPYASFIRFQSPGPVKPWDGVFKANREYIRCPQKTPVITNDCLTLNVYTPLRVKEKLPVMAFFHGGAFYEGSSNAMLYGGKALVENEVILITINYRLGIEGFLSLGIKEIPGNVGLKDQVAALRWIKSNIQAFGGDEENVTIFGESAGSASVSYHLLSPLSKGLFHKAILQGGSSLSPWAFQPDPLDTAKELAKMIGYETSDPYELHKIFTNHTKNELMANHMARKKGDLMLSEFVFVPCIEREIDGDENFLNAHPFDLLSDGKFNKVPVMIGTNIEDGYFFAIADDLIKYATVFDSIPRNILMTYEDKLKAVPRINKAYTGSIDKTIADSLLNFSRFDGDVNFKFPITNEMTLLSRFNEYPVYSFTYSYEGWRNAIKLLLWLYGNRKIYIQGATHTDELFYLFSQDWFPNFIDGKMMQRMTGMWTNFAKYSDPTPNVTDVLPVKWHSFQENQKSMIIDEEMSEAPLWDDDAFTLWREMYNEYGYKGSNHAPDRSRKLRFESDTSRHKPRSR